MSKKGCFSYGEQPFVLNTETLRHRGNIIEINIKTLCLCVSVFMLKYRSEPTPNWGNIYSAVGPYIFLRRFGPV